jgi:magnesium transporter
MISRYVHRNIVWVDLESPTREEVMQIASEFGLDSMIAEELLIPSTKLRSELHHHYMYMVLYFPVLRHAHLAKEQEIDFVLGKNFLITTHYDVVDPLHRFSKIFEAHSLQDKDLLGDHAGYVFFFMLKKLYRAIDHEIEYVREDLSKFEHQIFDGKEVELVSAISKTGRDLLNMRQTIEPHREMLKDFETDGPRMFGEEYVTYVKALSNEYYRVHNHIMRSTEVLRELRETNNSLLTTKQNETMRVLTVMALFTLPLALIVEIYGFHSSYNPFLELKYSFLYLVLLVIFGALTLYLLFKHKKWL